jgi:hypothetical protein
VECLREVSELVSAAARRRGKRGAPTKLENAREPAPAQSLGGRANATVQVSDNELQLALVRPLRGSPAPCSWACSSGRQSLRKVDELEPISAGVCVDDGSV